MAQVPGSLRWLTFLVIVPEARRMPFYRLINDPFRALQERGNVRREAEMAALFLAEEAAG